MAADERTFDDAFSKLLQQYQEAVHDDELGNAETIVHELFASAAAWCSQNPSPEFELRTVAYNCLEGADWAGAKAAYQQILSLPSLEPAFETRAHSDLAALFRLLNRRFDAVRHASLATAAARRINVSVILADMLGNEARCLIGCDQIDLARDFLDEALSLINDDKLFCQRRASILTLRAECDIHRGRYADAESDLVEAFGLLQPLSRMEIAAGIHADLACWWAITARLRTARNDRNGAVTAWKNAVQIAKHVASLPHAASVYTKFTVAEMLHGLASFLAVGSLIDRIAAARVKRAKTKILRSIGITDGDAK